MFTVLIFLSNCLFSSQTAPSQTVMMIIATQEASAGGSSTMQNAHLGHSLANDVTSTRGATKISTFSDTIALTDALESKQWAKAKQILENYFSGIDDLEKHLNPTNGNGKDIPFLYSSLDAAGFFEISPNLTAPRNPNHQKLKASHTPLPLPSSTELIEGVATFLATRFKDEIRIEFFRDLEKKLNKHKEFKVLFPNTWLVLTRLATPQDNWVHYKANYAALQSAIQRDLNQILDSSTSLLETKTYESMAIDPKSKKCQHYLEAVYALKIARDLKAGHHPLTIIDRIARDPMVTTKPFNDHNAAHIIQLMDMATRNLASADGTRLVSYDAFAQLLENPEAAKIFMALVYVREKAVIQRINFQAGKDRFPLMSLFTPTSQKEMFESLTPQHSHLLTSTDKNNLLDLIARRDVQSLSQIFAKKGLTQWNTLLTEKKWTALVKAITSHPELQQKHISFLNYLGNITFAADMLEMSLKTLKDASTKQEVLPQTTRAITHLIETTSDLRALLGVDNPIVQEMQQTWRPTLQTAMTMYQGLSEKAYSLTLINLITILESQSDLSSDTYTALLEFSQFLSGLSQATNAKEVGQAIDSVALPVGSWRVKRQSKSTIGLNAYVGGFAALESFDKDVSGDGGTRSLGITAPVGLDFSWGLPAKGSKRTYNGNSLSLFLSMIDVGALVSYQLDNDNLKGFPDLNWQNLLAPGIYAYWGLKNKPISIGIGGQYGPSIRKLERPESNTAMGSFDEVESYRIGVTVTIDIPLFRFSHKK